MSNKRYQLFTLLPSSLESQEAQEKAVLLLSKEQKLFGEM